MISSKVALESIQNLHDYLRQNSDTWYLDPNYLQGWILYIMLYNMCIQTDKQLSLAQASDDHTGYIF